MSKATKLKSAINTLCTLRCENMRLLYEGADSSTKESKEKEIQEQENLVNDLIDELATPKMVKKYDY